MDKPIDDDAWDEAPAERRAPVAAIPVLHLDGFDGPMDLLLDLAERQLIDLGRMSILDLAEQFVAAMQELAARVAIERRADWLVLATRLVLLRTRLLFPASPDQAADAAREAEHEIDRLDELARMRAAGQWLARRPQLGLDVFARPRPKEVHESGYVALMEACLVVLRGRPGDDAFEPADIYRVEVPDFWRIPQAIARVRTLLAAHPEGGPLTDFLPAIGREEAGRTMKLRVALASTFAASLELARQQALQAEQSGNFAVITLRGAA